MFTPLMRSPHTAQRYQNQGHNQECALVVALRGGITDHCLICALHTHHTLVTGMALLPTHPTQFDYKICSFLSVLPFNKILARLIL